MALLVGDVLRHAARTSPTAVAATLAGDEISFGELDERSNRTGRALAARGVGLGDRVAWWGDTSLDALPLFFALAKLGAVFAPINARLGPDEAAEVAGYARPSLVVVDDERASGAGAMEGPTASHAELARAAAGEDAGDLAAPSGLHERDPHVVFFTSGSTGRPKGVVLSHRANCLRTFPALAAAPTTGIVCMFPLFHMAGWTLALGVWQTRSPIHFVPVPDAGSLIETVARRRASRIYLIPAVWARVLGAGAPARELASLREADTGTSATPPELLAAIRDALPHTVTRVFYGSTEAGAATVLAHDEVLRKPGSVGRPQAGVDVRVDDGGEVCVRSELLMDGYFEQPDETATALREGWYHTGDLGVFDDEGYLSIVGRARDVIRTGGEAVAPAEVERALASYPGLAEVAVVGVPDPQWGEVVCAVVVPEPGVDGVTLDGLRAHLDGRLAGFKQPRRIEVFESLPRTPATGQVQRALIVERVQSRA